MKSHANIESTLLNIGYRIELWEHVLLPLPSLPGRLLRLEMSPKYLLLQT